ncbi:hypothetical protein ZWY2020_007328 [Hordeum vulgare]|nr:hypothetical protein ZWY2020_007328 [Hordeum vulgare]
MMHNIEPPMSTAVDEAKETTGGPRRLGNPGCTQHQPWALHALLQLPMPFRGTKICRRKLRTPPSTNGAICVSAESAVDTCPLEPVAVAAATATGNAAASTVSGVRDGDDHDEDDDGYGCETLEF